MQLYLGTTWRVNITYCGVIIKTVATTYFKL